MKNQLLPAPPAVRFLTLADLDRTTTPRRPAHLLLRYGTTVAVDAQLVGRIRASVRTVHVLGDIELADLLAARLDDVAVFLVADQDDAQAVVASWTRSEHAANREARNARGLDDGYLHGRCT